MNTKYYCRNCGAEIEIEYFKPSYICKNCNTNVEHKDLMRSWVLESRIAQLKAMHTLICNANDENIYMSWTYTVPDCPTHEDFVDIAMDDDEYNEVFDLFVKLIKEKGNRW
jgi:DNA-directed RNA polymerase subunit RPC12/RpoP